MQHYNDNLNDDNAFNTKVDCRRDVECVYDGRCSMFQFKFQIEYKLGLMNVVSCFQLSNECPIAHCSNSNIFYLRILPCSNDVALPMPPAPPPIVIASFIIFKEKR